MEEQATGYFQKGDCIEVSGKIIGLVSNADSNMFGLQRFGRTMGNWFLCPDISMYSNEVKHYQDKYWIKKVSAPKEYKLLKTVPLNA